MQHSAELAHGQFGGTGRYLGFDIPDPEDVSGMGEALQTFQHDPHAGKALREELAGLRSYRVSRFRIVHCVADRDTIEPIAVGPRKTIYEETFRLLQREQP